jgi:hypothetical protein
MALLGQSWRKTGGILPRRAYQKNCAPPASGGAQKSYDYMSGLYRFYINREHSLKDLFEGHGVTAKVAPDEKIAITYPLATDVLDLMGVVCAFQGSAKLLESDSLAFFSIALRFFDLTDHAVIHAASV